MEPIGMTLQLANRSVVQPLGVLEDLIFPADFYVLDMEDETSEKESTLILGRPFPITARAKIDVHAGTLSMEFGDNLVQFNIFEAMKHPIEDHSLFGIDLIDELVEEYFQLDSHSEDTDNFAEITNLIGWLRSISKEEADYDESGEVHNLSDSVDNNNDIANFNFEAELLDVLDQELSPEKGVGHNSQRPRHLVPKSTQKASKANSSSLPPPMELKPLSSHLKYAYLDAEQQLPEDKLLQVLREHKKALGWKLSDLPRINPSIYMHRILMEEEAKPIRQQ
ncbi:hypothetical protein CR513_53315, partial [Mucuna pruriens]